MQVIIRHELKHAHTKCLLPSFWGDSDKDIHTHINTYKHVLHDLCKILALQLNNYSANNTDEAKHYDILCLICHCPYAFHKNSSGPLSHWHYKTCWRCPVVYGTKMLAAHPKTWSKWSRSRSDFLLKHIPQALDRTEIWGIWRPGQHLELFVMSLKPFLNDFRCVAWSIILWKVAAANREYHCHDRMNLVCNDV